MKQKRSILLIYILIAIFLFGCVNKPIQNPVNEAEFISGSEFLLDTIVNIKIYDYKDEAIFEEVFEYIQTLENILSVHVKGSDLWNIKENAGKKWTTVSAETMEIFKRSIEMSVISEGLFDITSGPLIDLWDIDTPNGYYPSDIERKYAMSFINYKDIEIDEKNNKIYLKKEGMNANLGAIAKGFIADKVKEFLKERGVNKAIINLGGNILLVGNKPDGTDFRIGVQDPDASRGKYLGVLSITDKSIVSSGVYERYFYHEGKKYHHILNPFTGFPQENNLKGVSIISSLSTDGDAFSTTVFLMGIEKGMQLVESTEGVEAIFVTEDNKLYFSSGLRDIFELAPDSEYTIVE
ncbi:MAG: FAD:protein FMN transferase [Clostridiales bacterium]|nr:FAD:protein FMN transferase [Clostridiales bacterium]